MKLVISALFAISLSLAVAAADDRIGIWIPNPCDRVGALPPALQKDFQKNNPGLVADLNVIYSGSTYHVPVVMPEATETSWSWVTRGSTMILTSQFNEAAATCMSGHVIATTTTGDDNATRAAVTTTSHENATRAAVTETMTMESGLVTTSTSVSANRQISSPSLGTTRRTATTSHSTDVETSKTVTSKAATSKAATSTSTLPETTDMTISAVSSDMSPSCLPQADSNWIVDPGWVGDGINASCRFMNAGHPSLWPNYAWADFSVFHGTDASTVAIFFYLNNTGNPEVVQVAPSSDLLSVCEEHFQSAWQKCNNGGKGGSLTHQGLEWKVYPIKF